MKKMICNIKSLAVLLVAGTAFTACSSSDDEIVNNQPEQTGAKTYSISVQTSKNANNVSTRGLDNTYDGLLNVYWRENEIVEVYQDDKKVGRLYSAPSPSNETRLDGTVSGVDTSKPLTFYYHTKGTPDYTKGQDGSLEKLESTYDICEPRSFSPGSDIGYYSIDEINKKIVLKQTSIFFYEYKQAFVRFNFNKVVTELKVVVGETTYTITSGTAKDVFYVAIPQFSDKTVVLKTKNGGTSYTDVTQTGKTFENGYFYTINVKLN